VAFAKSRLCQLQEFQTILDEFWRSMRWITDVVTFARDKQSIYGISLENINDSLTNSNVLLEDEESTFQIPTINLYSPTVNSPNTPPPAHPTSRRPSRDDSAIDTNFFSNHIRINTSTSSYSLIDSLRFMNAGYNSDTFCQKNISDDMRRCVSASKLINGSVHRNVNKNENTEYDQWANHSHNLSDSCIHSSGINTNIDLQKFSDWDENDIYGNDLKSNLEFSNLVTDNSFRPIVLSNNSNTNYADSSDKRRNSVSKYTKNYSFNCENDSNDYYESPNSSNHSSMHESNKFCDTIFNRNRVIRVYAAYDSGLPFGTSVKLQVTFETTVKEIIELVVKHLNSTVISKGEKGPIYDLSDLSKFCIIAVFSSNVKHLNDDFKVLNLQTPWNKAKLCIKIKDH
jgi:hypothetical protein